MLIYSFITDYQAFNLRYKDNTARDKNETKVGKQSANLGKNNEPIQNRLSFLIDCKSVTLHHLTFLSFPMVRPAWDNWWFEWGDLCDRFFYVAFAEQDAPTDFMGLDFTAINSGRECNKGDFQKRRNFFTGEIALVLFSSNRNLHLLHFLVYGFPDHFGKSFDGQTVQDKLFFYHIINRLMIAGQ